MLMRQYPDIASFKIKPTEKESIFDAYVQNLNPRYIYTVFFE